MICQIEHSFNASLKFKYEKKLKYAKLSPTYLLLIDVYLQTTGFRLFQINRLSQRNANLARCRNRTETTRE